MMRWWLMLMLVLGVACEREEAVEPKPTPDAGQRFVEQPDPEPVAPADPSSLDPEPARPDPVDAAEVDSEPADELDRTAETPAEPIKMR